MLGYPLGRRIEPIIERAAAVRFKASNVGKEQRVVVPPFVAGAEIAVPRFEPADALQQQRLQLGGTFQRLVRGAPGGQSGVEITVDEGEPTEHGEESRDDVVFANIAVGIVKRIKAALLTDPDMRAAVENLFRRLGRPA